MVSSIFLGNFSQQNGRTVVSGSASGGLDTEGLIKSLTEAKRIPAVQLEDRIESNTALSGAYGEMSDILSRFRDASDFLRNPPGVQNAADNVFKYRTTSISGNTALSASSYLSITAEAGAVLSGYEITVDSLATYNTKTTNTFAIADLNTLAVGGGLPFTAGTLTLGAAAIAVTVDGDDTVNDIVGKINAVKSQSKVEASVIQVASGQYRMVLKSTQTGTDMNYTLDPGSLAVVNGGFFSQVDAVDAQLTIDGTVVTRQNNSMDDVVDGLTFNLLAETGVGEELTVGVAPDTELVRSAIINFVDSYNEFRVFAAKQLETEEDGTPKDSALLSGSSTLRTVLSRVNGEIASVVQGLTAGSFDRLADIGLNFDDFDGDEETPFTRNIIVIDEAKLDSALSSRFEEVRTLFEFDYTSNNPNLAVFSRTNALDATAISLTIDRTNSIYEATFDNGTGPQTVSLSIETLSSGGLVLNGLVGTALEGLTLIYTSASDAVIDLNLSQGMGDRLFNALDEVLDDEDGLLSVELASIEDSNQRMQDEISRIDDYVERYREQLLAQFSELERAISQSDIILQSLNAQANARLAAS